MVAVIALGIIILCSIIIWKVGNVFATSSSNIGDYLKLPRSVKGATFDAIASSFPELMVAVFSVISFKQFEVGIATIAGSSLFNLLVIPGLSVLVAPKLFKISKETLTRDALFYLIAVFALVAALAYSSTWGIMIPVIFILIYIWYLHDIHVDTKTFKKNNHNKPKKINLGKNIFIALGTMLIMGIATYFLTEQAISFSQSIGVHPIIISFTVIAAATSIPDTVVSVANAKKGNIDDAASNVFGSNIFDILMGLSIPLLIAMFFTGKVNVAFDQMEIMFGLFGATIISIYFLRNLVFRKKEGIILILLYILFIAYVVGSTLI